MEAFMTKWGLIFKAFAITLVLLVVRLVFDYLNFDILSVTTLITAFIGGAIFTIAIIFAGTLTDYKESEKIPSEIATSIRTFYSDLDLIRVQDKTLVHAYEGKYGLPDAMHQHEFPEQYVEHGAKWTGYRSPQCRYWQARRPECRSKLCP